MNVRFDLMTLTDTIIRPANTTTYAAGDVISEVTSSDFFTLTKEGRRNGLTASIDAALMMSSAYTSALLPDLEAWIFHTAITKVADNSAFAPTDAEVLTCIGIIKFPVADWNVGLSGAGAGGNIIQFVEPINRPIRSKVSGNVLTLFVQLVVRNAYVPIDSESFTLQLDLSVD